MRYAKANLNKPAYIGMCILELSKLLMYQPRNGYIKIKYGNNLRLSFTDTYSLLYEIKNEDLSMKNIYGDLEMV